MGWRVRFTRGEREKMKLVAGPSARIMRSMKEESARNGAGFFLVTLSSDIKNQQTIYPILPEPALYFLQDYVIGSFTVPFKLMTDLMAEMDIPFITLPFTEMGNAENHADYLEGDLHFSPAYNRLLAENLARQFAAKVKEKKKP